MRDMEAIDEREGPYPWAREIRGEFPHHDYQPPRDGWPGGDRFGFQHQREYTARNYAPGEHALAEEWSVALPAMDWLITETWWDLPSAHFTRVEGLAERGLSMAEFLGGVGELRQVVYTARRYVARRWEHDPLADIRRRARQGEGPSRKCPGGTRG